MRGFKIDAIGKLGTVITGSTPLTSDSSNFGGDIPFVTPGELGSTTPITTAGRTLSVTGVEGSKLLPEGAVLICCIGSLGKAGIAGTILAINQQINGVIFDPARVLPRYGLYALRQLKDQLQAMAPATTVPIVNKSRFEKLTIPVPPLSEQQRIVDILDQADALSAKWRVVLAGLDLLSQSIFLDMFGDPLDRNSIYPRVELAQVVKGKSGIKAGPFGSSLKKEEYTEDGYRVYGQEQVISGTFDVGSYHISPVKYEQLKSYSVAEGDLLISLVGSFGHVLVVPHDVKPGVINPRLLKVTPDTSIILPEFLAAQLTMPSVKAALAHSSHGGTMGILNAGLLRRAPVVVPPMTMQKEYLRRRLKVEHIREANSEAIITTEAFFSTLQYKAFRGEL